MVLEKGANKQVGFKGLPALDPASHSWIPVITRQANIFFFFSFHFIVQKKGKQNFHSWPLA